MLCAPTFFRDKLLYRVYRKKGSAAVDDKNLIRRIKSGDTCALDELIQKYYGDLYAYCYRKLGPADSGAAAQGHPHRGF